jgi:predicted RNase H-like HicB family nuclease
MTFTIEYEQNDDGRWQAEVVEMPGILAYGEEPEEAVERAQALAMYRMIERLEQGENIP